VGRELAREDENALTVFLVMWTSTRTVCSKGRLLY